MEWHDPTYLPAHAVRDPRLRPRHISLLLAARYLDGIRGDWDDEFQVTNRELMRLGRIKDRETFYDYRSDLHQLGYLTHISLSGKPAYYRLPERAEVPIPRGIVTDWRITTAGSLALYVALSTLAEELVNAQTDPDLRPFYGHTCTMHNSDLMTLCGYSTRRQLTRYRNELVDLDVLEVDSHLGLPPTYTLLLNVASNVQYETAIVSG